MNNLLSYCGLVDPRISASDKDLPVLSVGNEVLYAKILSAILPNNKRKHLPDSALATKMGRTKKNKSQFITINSP